MLEIVLPSNIAIDMMRMNDDVDVDDDDLGGDGDGEPWVKHTPRSPSTSLDNSQRSAGWESKCNENNSTFENSNSTRCNALMQKGIMIIGTT